LLTAIGVASKLLIAIDPAEELAERIRVYVDPLHFCIAAGPLSVYLLMVGLLNLYGRPFVTTGARDAAALAIGISGLVVAGPMELFFPEGAASRFGPIVWLGLIVLYGLCVSLFVLLMRARIVIYNMNMEQLRPTLTAIAMKLDKKSRWSSDSLLLPDLKVHLHMESVEWLRNVQLTAGGNHQSYDGWRKLENELTVALKNVKVAPNLLGMGMLLMAAAMATGAGVWMLSDQTAVAQALAEMLRR
jgi:hypothetical protein